MRRNRTAVPCDNCGKPLERTPNRLRDNVHHFCNKRCYGEWATKNRRGNKSNGWQGGPNQVICEQCGISFEKNKGELSRSDHSFCCPECYQEWRKGKKRVPPNVWCAHCGLGFRVNSLRLRKTKLFFCSMTCRVAYGQIEVTCANCGTSKITRQGKLKPSKSGLRFCSRQCSVAYFSPPPNAWCVHCGRGLRANSLQLKQKLIFCSMACRSAYSWIEVTCANCGAVKAMQRGNLRSNRHKNGLYFCSNDCSAAYFSRENHPNWNGGFVPYDYGPNWRRQACKARARDGHRCQHCGKAESKFSRKLDVHHIIPFREFGYIRGQNDNYKKANTLSNLITLCLACHNQAESGHVALQPVLL